MDQCFLNEQCVLLENHAVCKRFIQCEIQTQGFHIAKYRKFIDSGFKFHIAGNLLENDCLSNAGVVSKKDIHNYLNTHPFSNYLLFGLDFLKIFQSKIYYFNSLDVGTDNETLSSLKANIIKICKDVKQFSSSPYFFVLENKTIVIKILTLHAMSLFFYC